MTLPSKVHRMQAITAVQDFLHDSIWQEQITEYGWGISCKDDLTLLVSLTARSLDGAAETFMLRLICDYYPIHPPDVQFVNPSTLKYVPGQDHYHVADLRADYCYVHLNYPYQNSYEYGPQLVCSSMSLGYYFSNHVPTPDQAWQAGRHLIGASISTVYRALRSSDYHGRHN